MKECTYILHQGEALVLVLVVLMLLLLFQVLVFGRLKTHGYHLCASQHLAALPGGFSVFQSDKSGTFRRGLCALIRGGRTDVLVGMCLGMMVSVR